MAGFKAVLELFFVRMKLGICDEDIKLRTFIREEMPKALGIVKLATHLLGKYVYSGKHEKSVLSNFKSPIA